MKTLLLILFLFVSMYSYSQERLDNTESVVITVVMKPIIVIPDFIERGEDFQISLISGLSPIDLKWKHDGVFIDTPDDLVLIFSELGVYIPYVFNKELKSYKIEIF